MHRALIQQRVRNTGMNKVSDRSELMNRSENLISRSWIPLSDPLCSSRVKPYRIETISTCLVAVSLSSEKCDLRPATLIIRYNREITEFILLQTFLEETGRATIRYSLGEDSFPHGRARVDLPWPDFEVFVESIYRILIKIKAAGDKHVALELEKFVDRRLLQACPVSYAPHASWIKKRYVSLSALFSVDEDGVCTHKRVIPNLKKFQN